jgi:hypothetical protein
LINPEANTPTEKQLPEIPASKPSRVSRGMRTLAWNLFIPVIFIVIVMFFFPARGSFQFSLDEGIDLMKSALVEKGYSLYEQVWNDQAPISTYIFAVEIRFFGNRVGVARFTMLLFASLLLWSAFKYLELVFGKWQAVLGAVLIFLLPRFLVLSTAVLIGLPAISLALLALLVTVYWHRNYNPWLLVLSAGLMALSVFIKLFTLFVAPILAGGILLDAYLRFKEQRAWFKTITPVLLWGIIFAGVSAIFVFGVIGIQYLPQVLNDHVEASSTSAFAGYQYTLLYVLTPAVPVLLLGGLGLIFALKQKKWLALYLAAWAAAAFLLFVNHRPVWDHHQLLITIPAAMLAAVAVYEALLKIKAILRQQFQFDFQGILVLAAVIGIFILVFRWRTPETIRLLALPPQLSATDLGLRPLELKFLTEMEKYRDQTHWVVTDLAMYPFRLGLLVPPEIAVFSNKRIETGNLTEAQLLEVIKEYNPEQILLGRYRYPEIDGFLDAHYTVVHSNDGVFLYIRNDIQSQ